MRISSLSRLALIAAFLVVLPRDMSVSAQVAEGAPAAPDSGGTDTGAGTGTGTGTGTETITGTGAGTGTATEDPTGTTTTDGPTVTVDPPLNGGKNSTNGTDPTPPIDPPVPKNGTNVTVLPGQDEPVPPQPNGPIYNLQPEPILPPSSPPPPQQQNSAPAPTPAQVVNTDTKDQGAKPILDAGQPSAGDGLTTNKSKMTILVVSCGAGFALIVLGGAFIRQKYRESQRNKQAAKEYAASINSSFGSPESGAGLMAADGGNWAHDSYGLGREVSQYDSRYSAVTELPRIQSIYGDAPSPSANRFYV